MNLMEKYMAKLKQNERQNRPVRDILSEKYNQIAEWLHSHDLTSEEIKESLPELYQDIQDAIEKLDYAFINEDLTVFQDSLNKIKGLYTEAMLRCGRFFNAGAVTTAELKKLPKKHLKDIQEVKETFEKSTVEEVKTRKEH